MAVERFPDRSRPRADVRPQHRRPEPDLLRRRRTRPRAEVGAIIAPPTFVQASAQFDDDYPLRPKVGQPWFGSGRKPSRTRASQRGAAGAAAAAAAAARACTPSSTTVPPRRCGSATCSPPTTRPGKTWEKEGRRAGKLVFSETITEYRDQNGELVVTARGVGVRTETRSSEVGADMALKASELEVGQTFTASSSRT